MGLFRADTTSFNQLLVSLGVICVALALIAPWLFLRELSPVTISAKEVHAMTPVGKSIIKERQDQIRVIQSAAPIVSLLLLFLGLALLLKGMDRMYGLQDWHDRRLKAQAQKDEALLETQSPEEQQDRLADEVDSHESSDEGNGELPEGDGSGPSNAGGSPVPPDEPITPSGDSSTQEELDPDNEPSSHSTDQAIKVETAESRVQRRRTRASQMKSQVLGQLEARTPFGYDFRPTPKLTQKTGISLLMDGLYESQAPGDPDWIIELKFGRISSAGRLIGGGALAADQLIAKLAKYDVLRQRNALGWLILVIDTEELRQPNGMFELVDEATNRYNRQLGDFGASSVVFDRDIRYLDPEGIMGDAALRAIENARRR